MARPNWNGSALCLVYPTCSGGSAEAQGLGIAGDSSGDACQGRIQPRPSLPALEFWGREPEPFQEERPLIMSFRSQRPSRSGGSRQ